MASNYPTNEQRTNYSRLCRAIVDLSADVLRALLNRQVSPANIRTEIRQIPESTKVIKTDQWKVIKNAASLGTYKAFDFSLLCLVLRILSVRDLTGILQSCISYQTLYTSVQNCPALFSEPRTKLTSPELKDLQNVITTTSYSNCKDELLWKLYTHLCTTSNHSFIHPSVAWGSTKMPDSAHTTVGDDIERLRHIRNQAYAHVPSSEIPIKEFNNCWDILENVMIRLDKEIPGGNYKASLDQIKIVCMDADLEKQFLDDIKKMSEGEQDMREEVRKIKDDVLAIKEDVKELKVGVQTVKGSVVVKDKRPIKRKLHYRTSGIKKTNGPSSATQSFEKVEDRLNTSTQRQYGLMSDKSLGKLASSLGGEWYQLAIYLGLTVSELDCIKLDNPYQTVVQTTKALIKWRNKDDGEDDVKMKQLYEALEEIGRHDLAFGLQNECIETDVNSSLQ